MYCRLILIDENFQTLRCYDAQHGEAHAAHMLLAELALAEQAGFSNCTVVQWFPIEGGRGVKHVIGRPDAVAVETRSRPDGQVEIIGVNRFEPDVDQPMSAAVRLRPARRVDAGVRVLVGPSQIAGTRAKLCGRSVELACLAGNWASVHFPEVRRQARRLERAELRANAAIALGRAKPVENSQ